MWRYCWLFEVCGLRVKGHDANEGVVGLATPFVGWAENVSGKMENARGGTDNVRGGNEKLGGKIENARRLIEIVFEWVLEAIFWLFNVVAGRFELYW